MPCHPPQRWSNVPSAPERCCWGGQPIYHSIASGAWPPAASSAAGGCSGTQIGLFLSWYSVAVDITASEAFGFSIAAIMTEIVRGYLEDLGMASATAQATPIVTDNDATMRIASDAASAKRALHILRRLAHARELKTRGEIAALHLAGLRNPANIGTKYVTANEYLTAARLLQNA